jgi:hypothetical protein
MPASGPSKVLIVQSRSDSADSRHLPAHLQHGGLVGAVHIPQLTLGVYMGPSVAVLKVFDATNLGERHRSARLSRVPGHRRRAQGGHSVPLRQL